ncbi:MAG: DUF5010 C-terminal domain-containing protein [Bacteroidota bacterium]|nr:DUF5010 C-terminal domain-containing protein [Bacteroidota bacterium]
MKKHSLLSAFLILFISITQAQINFSDNFNNGVSTGWQWLDQDNSAWNTNGGRLNMKRYPGHGFYQTPNDRVPVLNYFVGNRVNGTEAIVTVGFDVNRQYGQAGMIWYYDKDNWTKYVIEFWWDRGIYVINLREQNGVACHDASCEMDYQYSNITSVDLKMRYENGKYITSLRPAGSNGAWTNHFTFNANPDGGNNLRIGLFSQADSGSNDWAWFDNFSLNVPGAGLSAPSINSQPNNATAPQGGSVTFNVQASGNPSPSYQWYKNNNVISGANASSLSINNAQSADAGSYKVVVSNSQGSVTSNTVNLTVNAPIPQGPYTTAVALPGTIQAENYNVGGSGVAYADNTSGNTGGQYRNDDVDIEACAEGGYNVGWIENGEWLEYTVSPNSGTYNINLRYATGLTPGSVKMLLDGVTLGTFNFSNTGGWQNWQNATLSNINITGGTNKILRLELGGGLNLNSIQFNQVSVDNVAPSAPTNLTAAATGTTAIALSWNASTDNVGVTGYDIYNGTNLAGSTASTSFTVNNLVANTAYSFTVKSKDAAGNISSASNTATATTQQNPPPATQSPYSGTAVALPGTLQAENYDLGGGTVAYADNTSGNTGGQFRSDDVDIEACAEGGYNVGWIDSGEWLEYTVSPNSGAYNINLRYASAVTPGTVKLLLDGVTLGTFTLASTGGWQNWQNTSLNNINISGGNNKILRLEFGGGFNVNYLQFNQITVDVIAPSAPTNLTATAIGTTSIALAWTAANDNVAVTGYDIYIGAALVGSTAATTFTVNSLSANTAYSFTVKAKDAAGNISASSNTASATTQTPSTALNFNANFNGSVTPPLIWLDEDASAWNLNNNRLNMKRYSGCGFFCNAKVPVLYYPSVPFNNGMYAQVKVGFDVDRKYGQAGMIVYFNNDTYAKLVIEYFFDQGINIILLQEIDGVKQNNLVLSGSDNVPYGATSVEIKINYADGKFTSSYRPIGSTSWNSHCITTAIPNRGPVNIGLFSQADSGSNDWAWFDDFSIFAPGATPPPTTNQTPYLGAPVALPGKVEAENYDLGGSGIAYNDINTGNNGNAYRTDNVDIEACAEGGYNVGWTDAGEWLEYTVAPTAGTYTINLRYASGMDNTATVRLLLDGVTLGSTTVPNTGGWQTYKTISFNNVQLSNAGSAILRLEFSSWGSNINYIEFIKNSTVTSPVTGTVTRETWSNVGGTLISDIPLNTTPTSTSVLTSLEIPVNSADNYGTRIKGYIVPTTNGTYNFYISGDDYCQFWLSASSDPAGKSKVAEVAGWTNSREWAKYPSQKSANINLTAGTRYYFEILHKEGGGGDNVAVGWTGPGITSIAVIGSANISQYTTGSRQELSSASNNAIYPVPFSNYLTVSSSETISSISMKNIFGEIVITENNLDVMSTTLNTEILSSGYYIIEITSTNGSIFRKKIVKQ